MACGVWTWILKLCIFPQFLNWAAPQTVHMRNVAINQSCDMSSKYSPSSGGCSAAINGKNDTTLIMGSQPNCIHTADIDTAPYWWVDLGQVFAISKITIFGRKDYIARMVCVNVSLDGQLVKRFEDLSGWVSERYYIAVRREGKVINITRDCRYPSDDIPVINICEVQVWVCDYGWYGDCTHTCGHCAGSSTCGKINGSCTSCDTGFQPLLCQACIDGRYGDNCAQTCGNCAEGPVCDKVNGGCNSCRPGFQGPLCKACANGFYGENCAQTCGHCGDNSVCDNVNGSCGSCETGFQRPLCKVCEDGRYGGNCTQTCGDCGGDSICDKVTGSCKSCKEGFKLPECKDCEDGHFNVSNSCQNTCGGGCNDTCSKTDGTCQYRPGWEPSLCQGCSVGLWGDRCSRACGDGCENRTCDTVDGTCTCMNGWATPRCEDCQNESASTAGPIVGAVCGSIASCVVGFLLGILFMRCRLYQAKNIKRSVPVFSPSNQREFSCSPPEESRPPFPDSEHYELSSQPANVYDSLKAARDDNVYTTLNAAKEKGAR